MSAEESSYHDVMDEKDLPPEGMRIVKLQGRRIALVRKEGRVHALDNDCPHVGGYLGQGTLQGDSLVCPLHQMAFDLVTGKATNRAGGYSVAVHEVKLEKGRVWVRLR